MINTEERPAQAGQVERRVRQNAFINRYIAVFGALPDDADWIDEICPICRNKLFRLSGEIICINDNCIDCA